MRAKHHTNVLKAKHADDLSTDDEEGGIGTNATSNNSNTKPSKSATNFVRLKKV
jgi:hypothetical protein